MKRIYIAATLCVVLLSVFLTGCTQGATRSFGGNMTLELEPGQKLEMITLARESAHSKMPVTHWIFSWQEGEQPTREQIEELMDCIAELGCRDYGIYYRQIF